MNLKRFLPLVLFSTLACCGSSHAQSITDLYGSPWSTRPMFSSTRSIVRTKAITPARRDARVSPKLLSAARIAEQSAHRRSQRLCWRYVKKALLSAGAVKSYPRTNYAKQAGTELTSSYGFKRLAVRNPRSAPVGAVLVYGGRGPGHVELRTARGFASDYRSPYPAALPFLGAYIKSV